MTSSQNTGQLNIRHIYDQERFFNGSNGGPWAICGRPLGDPTQGLVTDCPDCTRLSGERRRPAVR
jgi:hypothetical protein